MFAYVNGMETVAFRLPEPLKERVAEYAETIGESQSVAGRRLLRDSFDCREELEDERKENDRLRAENDRLRTQNERYREELQENELTTHTTYSLLILSAFLLGGAGSMSVDLFGQSAGVVGIVLLGAAILVTATGTGRLSGIYGDVFGKDGE